MTTSVDAVVVGAGVIGSSVALELAKDGRTVLVIDKAGGAGHGSTSSSSALIRFNYSTLDTVSAAWESKFCWQAWEQHLGFRDPLGLASFRRTGIVHLDVPMLPREHSLRLFDQVGIPYEELDPEQLVERFPALDNGRYWPNKPVTDDAFWVDSTETLGATSHPTRASSMIRSLRRITLLPLRSTSAHRSSSTPRWWGYISIEASGGFACPKEKQSSRPSW